MKRLRSSQVEDFLRDGALSPIPVLSEEEVIRARAGLAEMELAIGGALQRIDHPHLHFRWAFDLTCHSAILGVIEDILGPDVLVHSTRIFYKHPRDGTFVNWHQDGGYSRLSESRVVTAWIALSDSTPENGCVRVIPGSHRQGVLAHHETNTPFNLSNHGEEVDADVDESTAADLVLAAGEMSLHDINVVHSSWPNHSDRCRIGFSATYATPAIPAMASPVIRARGSAPAPHLRFWNAPPQETIAAALDAYGSYVRENRVPAPRLQERPTA
ncbi:MAG TPA: phytanoyl-CoA dioxygenase family protein [Thermoanaerobaculia bacterium]|jgi:hypothetical protein